MTCVQCMVRGLLESAHLSIHHCLVLESRGSGVSSVAVRNVTKASHITRGDVSEGWHL